MKRQKQLRARVLTALIGLAAAFATVGAVHAQSYNTKVVATGLDRPTGIVAVNPGGLVITQLPTPAIPGSQGGMNTVDLVRLGGSLDNHRIVNLTTGEPEPTNLALARNGSLYWTCKSAGVILERSQDGTLSLFLAALDQPSGIALDPWNNVYFTQIPTPGVPGSQGGLNTVNVTDGAAIEILTLGEPEPTDIAVDGHGTAYWTCKSAGVILMRTAAGEVSLLLKELNQPTGIALDHRGHNLYFTEVPTPGVPGSMGGNNAVWVLNLRDNVQKLVDAGDPEPTDITVARNGAVFWTCTSAGVIVEARKARCGPASSWNYDDVDEAEE